MAAEDFVDFWVWVGIIDGQPTVIECDRDLAELLKITHTDDPTRAWTAEFDEVNHDLVALSSPAGENSGAVRIERVGLTLSRRTRPAEVPGDGR
jgi:hypothetical protein